VFLHRSTDGVTYSLITSTLSATATSYDDFSLSADTMYHYRVYMLTSDVTV
jgi:hypothetical protein